jgi:hypothetical protein
MRTWRRSLIGLAAVVTAGTLVAGACGGDDDDAGDAPRDEAAEDATGPDAADTTTTAGGADDGAAGSADAPDAPDAGEIGEMSFCDGFRAALRADSTTALEGAQQLEVPDEIAEDWQVFMEFAQTSMSDAPAGESAEEIAAAGAAAEEATQNVLDYVGRECGYSVDATTGEVNEDDG